MATLELAAAAIIAVLLLLLGSLQRSPAEWGLIS